MFTAGAFRPAFLFGNPHVQTILSSSRIRTWLPNPMRAAARQKIVQVHDGTRLLGWHASPRHRPVRGTVVLLHGWEGSADSTYVLRTGRRLFLEGYAVFRLNFRDHGASYHLNQGLFFASMLDEVFEAVALVLQQHPHRPAFLVGFSLGGNFALRIARRCRIDPLPCLKHVVCISPVLDPAKATRRIDAGGYIRSYFLRKWRRSLSQKQAAFPDRYDFSDLMQVNSILGLTELLLIRYSNYRSPEEYFGTYTLIGDALKDLAIPTTLVTAEDDPIIPVADFLQLDLGSQSTLSLQNFGGHNGFICGWSLSAWYEQQTVSLFNSIASDERSLPDHIADI
jgi:predicted alpha/beta-fold hydrolase